jgi:hypothetical protein
VGTAVPLLVVRPALLEFPDCLYSLLDNKGEAAILFFCDALQADMYMVSKAETPAKTQ